MDTNKSRLLLFLFFTLAVYLSAVGQTFTISGKVANKTTQELVEYANISLFKQDSVFVAGMATDTLGNFSLANLPSENYVLAVSFIGFEPQRILIQNLSESVSIDVLLEESAITLGEVVVSAPSTVSRINQRIVFPTKLQKEHSANGMQLLNTMMLPGLRINPMSNSISASDGGTIILQINGANATSEEIQTLQPRQIKRIEYSDYAGIRYGHSSKIVNYIVLRDEKGGVIGIDLMNSLNVLAGGDVLFMKYNKGKSEYALNYTIAFQDIDNNSKDRFDNFYFTHATPIQREEKSDLGIYKSQLHDIAFAYNYQVSDSSFFNGKLKYNLTHQPHIDFDNALTVNGASAGRTFDGLNQSIKIPSVDLYYQHSFQNKQKIYANVVGSYIETDLQRDYYEYNGVDTTYRQQLQMASKKYSVIMEGIYEKGWNNGNLKVGLQHNQSFTEQTYLQDLWSESDLRQTESSLFSEWYYSKNNLSYSIGLRFNHSRFSSDAIGKSYNYLLPKAMFGYKLNEHSFLRYDMEMNQTNPTLVQLTDTEIRIDSLTAEKGNPLLKPYWNLMNTLFYENQIGLFTLNVNLRHHYKNNPIMESKREGNNMFVSMPNNMKSWNKYNAEITGKVGMIKDVLQVSLTGGYNYFDSRGNDYAHTYSNFYYRADLLAMYKRFMLIAQIQAADERLEGETLIKNNNYHYIAVQYNSNNFSVGIGAFNPFKNVSRDIMENRNANAPFKRVSYSDASQVVVLTCTWNLNFGKSSKAGEKTLDNKDTDYGIREIYK